MPWWWRRRPQEPLFDCSRKEDLEGNLGQKRFTLKELRVATDNFDAENIIGWGGYAKVYKGRLADGSWVAVKRSHVEEISLSTIDQQSHNELTVFSSALHRNLIICRGFCVTPKEFLLVFPYMPNGSVASRLRERKPGDVPLDWQTRKRIALGSARGLMFLHDQCNPKIIHRDVNASNILLNEEFEAVIWGFGLAYQMDVQDTTAEDVVCGTSGHVDPEYLFTGVLSEKTDVFGFGMLLLELITGQRAFDLARQANDKDLLVWVEKLFRQRAMENLVDPVLRRDFDTDSMEYEKLIHIALLCTQRSSSDRPHMKEVVLMLGGEEDMLEPSLL